MPEITVSMAAGRTDEQKAGMMRDITQALVKNLGVDADAVVIQINEAPLAHKMKGGKKFVERAAAGSRWGFAPPRPSRGRVGSHGAQRDVRRGGVISPRAPLVRRDH